MVPKLQLEFEPELARPDEVLDEEQLFNLLVKTDLLRRHPTSGTLGRHCTPAEVVLRILILKRLYGWSYAQTERFMNDSIVLRQFRRLYLQRSPDDTTLMGWANTIGSETVASLEERGVQLAGSLKLTRGRKLRIDGTVVETNIHHPTDDVLIADGVRVIGRLCAEEQRASCRRASQANRRASHLETALPRPREIGAQDLQERSCLSRR